MHAAGTGRWIGLFLAALAGAGPALAASDGSNGAVPVLVKSRKPLTPDVVKAIGTHGSLTGRAWPETDAVAMTVPQSKVADLMADPLVALVEPDQTGSSDAGRGDPGTEASPAAATVVPLPSVPAPRLTWNLSMAQTAGTG